MQQIQVQPVPLDLLKAILAPAQWSRLVTTAARARALFAGRVVWNVNATAHGGGVAEMLQSLLAYARGAGVDARWLVLDGDPEFFAITKWVHNALHGSLNPRWRAGDLAQSHRPGRLHRRHGRRVGVRAWLPRERGRTCVLATKLCPRLGGVGACAGDRAVHRPILDEEP